LLHIGTGTIRMMIRAGFFVEVVYSGPCQEGRQRKEDQDQSQSQYAAVHKYSGCRTKAQATHS
jgi:hypothetical protein